MGWLSQALGLETARPSVSTADIRFTENVSRVVDQNAAGGMAPPPGAGEVGLSGTVNYSGILEAENNTKLKSYLGLGRNQTWGEWERLQRTDPAVSKGLEMVAAPLRSASVEIETPEGGDENISAFVKDNMQEWLEPLWPEVIQQMTKGGLGSGFSVHEKVFATRRDKRVPGGIAWYCSKLAQRLPSSFDNDAWKEKDGELFSIRQSGIQDGLWRTAVDIPASKVLLFSWDRSGNNYAGYSALRSVWYVCKIRDKLLDILGIGYERESLGIPMATVDKEAPITDAQLTELQTFLKFLVAHENSSIVLPKGVALDWIYSPGANKGSIIEGYEKLGLVVLQALFAEQSYLGTSGTGARAVGEVHEAARAQFVDGVKGNIEAVFNGVGNRPYTALIRQIVDLNFGPQERYPKLTLRLQQGQVALPEFSAAMGTLTQAGVITVTADDENAVRQRMGLAPIDPKDREAALDKVAAEKRAQLEAVAKAQPQQTPGGGKPDQSEAPDVPPSSGAKPGAPSKSGSGASNFSDAQPFTPSRPLRLSEQHLDLQGMDAFHTAARASFERDVKDIIRDILREAKPAIREAMKGGDPTKLNALPLNTKLLAKYIEVFIERARAYGFRTAMQEKAKQPKGLLQKRAKGQSGIPADPALSLAAYAKAFHLEEEEEDDRDPPDTSQVERLVKAQTTLVTNKIRNRLKAEITDYAIDEARTGGDADSVADDVMNDVEESKGLRSDAGTVLTRSFSMGRDQFVAEHGKDVDHMEYSAVLDSNTCDPCEEMDGEEFELDSPDYDEAVPPLKDCEGGSNCRCIMIAIWSDDADDSDEPDDSGPDEPDQEEGES